MDCCCLIDTKFRSTLLQRKPFSVILVINGFKIDKQCASFSCLIDLYLKPATGPCFTMLFFISLIINAISSEYSNDDGGLQIFIKLLRENRLSKVNIRWCRLYSYHFNIVPQAV